MGTSREAYERSQYNRAYNDGVVPGFDGQYVDQPRGGYGGFGGYGVPFIGGYGARDTEFANASINLGGGSRVNVGGIISGLFGGGRHNYNDRPQGYPSGGSWQPANYQQGGGNNFNQREMHRYDQFAQVVALATAEPTPEHKQQALDMAREIGLNPQGGFATGINGRRFSGKLDTAFTSEAEMVAYVSRIESGALNRPALSTADLGGAALTQPGVVPPPPAPVKTGAAVGADAPPPPAPVKTGGAVGGDDAPPPPAGGTPGGTTTPADRAPGTAHNYGAENMPPVNKEQVQALQEAFGGKGTMPKHGADGKWGPETQAAFEKACAAAKVDPSKVNFASPNEETKKLEAYLQEHPMGKKQDVPAPAPTKTTATDTPTPTKTAATDTPTVTTPTAADPTKTEVADSPERKAFMEALRKTYKFGTDQELVKLVEMDLSSVRDPKVKAAVNADGKLEVSELAAVAGIADKFGNPEMKTTAAALAAKEGLTKGADGQYQLASAPVPVADAAKVTTVSADVADLQKLNLRPSVVTDPTIVAALNTVPAVVKSDAGNLDAGKSNLVITRTPPAVPGDLSLFSTAAIGGSELKMTTTSPDQATARLQTTAYTQALNQNDIGAAPTFAAASTVTMSKGSSRA